MGGWVGKRVSKRVSGYHAHAHTPIIDPPPDTVPPAPPAALFAAHPNWIWRGELCEHPLNLWRTVAKHPKVSDRSVFYALATQHDATTDGHGWYWIGQAVLMVAATGRQINVPQLVVVVLAQWCRRDAYGSDSDAYRAKRGERREASDTNALTLVPANAAQTGAGASDMPGSANDAHVPLTPAIAPLSAGIAPAPHPAVVAYIAAFGRTPNVEQTRRISTVTDLDAWRQVLADWQANDWKPGSVAGMLDRYAKACPSVGTAPDEPALTPVPIYTHPGLSSDERSDWIGRWHATPKGERAALLARLVREHPLEPQEDS